MNGDDLITLAGNLVANQALGNSEARYRSSVSRAYYGAFHSYGEALQVPFLQRCTPQRPQLNGHTVTPLVVLQCCW